MVQDPLPKAANDLIKQGAGELLQQSSRNNSYSLLHWQLMGGSSLHTLELS